MIKRYFDDPKDDVAFERCVDVLAELIEKYAGCFALSDISYEYHVKFASTPMVTTVFSYDDYRNRFCNYFNLGIRDGVFVISNNFINKCQKAS